MQRATSNEQDGGIHEGGTQRSAAQGTKPTPNGEPVGGEESEVGVGEGGGVWRVGVGERNGGRLARCAAV